MEKKCFLNGRDVDLRYGTYTALLSEFLTQKNFKLVPSHLNQLEILAACENHKAIATTTLGGVKYPLPQTAQMLLEEYILTTRLKRIFTYSISYRDEDVIDDNRHLRLFSMLEVESVGDFHTMIDFLSELCEWFYKEPIFVTYKEAQDILGITSTLTEDNETDLIKVILERYNTKYNSNVSDIIVALTNFPKETNPYFNMEYEDGNALKIDLLALSKSTGKALEIGGFAQRSSDVTAIRERFYTQTNGDYVKTLFSLFGEDRVMTALDTYLNQIEMFTAKPENKNVARWGGGIGLARLLDTIEVHPFKLLK